MEPTEGYTPKRKADADDPLEQAFRRLGIVAEAQGPPGQQTVRLRAPGEAATSSVTIVLSAALLRRLLGTARILGPYRRRRRGALKLDVKV